MKIAYVTDSGTGKSISQHASDGIISVPLQISDENTTWQDMETLSVSEMISLLREGHAFTTSQPSYGLVEECFESLKAQGVDLIIAVPICNGLSGTISTFTSIAENLGMKIICVDCYVTAVVEDYLVHRIRQAQQMGMQGTAVPGGAAVPGNLEEISAQTAAANEGSSAQRQRQAMFVNGGGRNVMS